MKKRQVAVRDPEGQVISLYDRLKPFGTAEKEGSWISSYAPTMSGRYVVEGKLDLIHGTNQRTLQRYK